MVRVEGALACSDRGACFYNLEIAIVIVLPERQTQGRVVF